MTTTRDEENAIAMLERVATQLDGPKGASGSLVTAGVEVARQRIG